MQPGVTGLNEALVVFVRGLIAFFTLLIFARLLGKQQISQLTFFDYILGITIGSIAGTLTTDLAIRAWPQWIGLFTWTVAVLVMQWVTLKSRHAAKFIDGEPVVVIMNGQIMEEAMGKMRYRMDDLLKQLRGKGIFDISQVEFAVLETSGQLSVLKKSQYQPLTPRQLNITTDYDGMSTELIYDGVVLEQNLKQVNLDRPWLEEQLKKFGVNDPKEVLLALLDTRGKLYIDTYRDHLKKVVDISDYKGQH